jgi:hypothetical protein
MSQTSATLPRLNRPRRLTSLLEARRASRSASKESNLAWLTLVATLPSSSANSLARLVHVGSSGRTSPEYCKQTEDGRLEACSGGWGNSGMGSLTEFLTLDTSESPNDVAVCLLSQIIEVGNVPPQCCLTPHNITRMATRLTKYGAENSPLMAELNRSMDGPATKPPSTDLKLSRRSVPNKAAKESE